MKSELNREMELALSNRIPITQPDTEKDQSSQHNN